LWVRGEKEDKNPWPLVNDGRNRFLAIKRYLECVFAMKLSNAVKEMIIAHNCLDCLNSIVRTMGKSVV
jgi:hypothetical protein